MNPQFKKRSQVVTVTMIAVIAALAAACSQQPPQQSSSAHLDPAPTASSTNANAAGTPAMDHTTMNMGDAGQANTTSVPTVAATADVAGAFGSGQPVSVTLHIRDIVSGKPMRSADFELAHTKTIHALGVDPSLTDYSHSHPQPAKKPGDWTYAFIPKYNRTYHIWLDVKPIGGEQQYVMFTLNEHAATAPVDKTLSLSAAAGNLTATLLFDAPLVAGQAVTGRLTIRRDGKPFAALEPVMGAYGHIVGISEDWQTIAHVHPMGAEPSKENDRGGPVIDFHLEPMHAGFLKLFAQIQVDGRDVFLPFGVSVGPSLANRGGIR